MYPARRAGASPRELLEGALAGEFAPEKKTWEGGLAISSVAELGLKRHRIALPSHRTSTVLKSPLDWLDTR
jgi:hypothetical protein